MRRLLLSTSAIAALALAPALAVAQVQSAPSGTTQEPRTQEHTQGGKSAAPAQHQMAPGKSAQTETSPGGNSRMNAQTQQAPGATAPQHQKLQGQAQPEPQRERKAPVQQSQIQQPRGGQTTEGEAQEKKGEVQQKQGVTGKAGVTRQHQAAAPSGRAAAAQQVHVTEQQRTQIHQRLAHFKVDRIEHPQFSVSVGAEIPRSVHVEVLPPEIVEIVPEYRGFDYVMVGDEIVIIDPDSLEIVAVIPA